LRINQSINQSGVGKIGPDKVDDEIRRITSYDEWHNLADEADPYVYFYLFVWFSFYFDFSFLKTM
jgi:hypothetical protein